MLTVHFLTEEKVQMLVGFFTCVKRVYMYCSACCRLMDKHLNRFSVIFPAKGAGAVIYVWTCWKTRHPYTRTRTPHRRDGHHSPAHTHHSTVPQLYGLPFKSSWPRRECVQNWQYMVKREVSLTELASLSFRYDCCTVPSSDSDPLCHIFEKF